MRMGEILLVKRMSTKRSELESVQIDLKYYEISAFLSKCKLADLPTKESKIKYPKRAMVDNNLRNNGGWGVYYWKFRKLNSIIKKYYLSSVEHWCEGIFSFFKNEVSIIILLKLYKYVKKTTIQIKFLRSQCKNSKLNLERKHNTWLLKCVQNKNMMIFQNQIK